MELSLFLAKIIGLFLVIVAGALLLNRKNVNLLFSIYRNPESVFLTGVLDTFIGLSLVFTHNIWVMNFQVIITLVGWILLLRGAGRMLFPQKVVRMLEKYKKMQSLITLMLVMVLIIGAYLAYMGFTA